jgi:hypothetical protein
MRKITVYKSYAFIYLFSFFGLEWILILTQKKKKKLMMKNLNDAT